MNEQRVRRLTGLSFILGAILINVPYFILIATFDYPAILRELTVIPGFPAWGLAGLVGSLCWLAWMIVLGIFLLRAVPEPRPINQLAATPA